MKPSLVLAALLAAGPALAAPGGPISALSPGFYACELPGDALGPAGRRQEAESFTVIDASSYRAAGGERGTYLLAGDIVTMTSGPKHGERFHRLSPNFLRKLAPDGTDSPLRCIRQVANNS